MFDSFMPVFYILTMEILECVIPCVTYEGVRVPRTAHEDFDCEVVYELADWDHLEVSVKGVTLYYNTLHVFEPQKQIALRKQKKICLLTEERGFYEYHNIRLSYPALVRIGTENGRNEAGLEYTCVGKWLMGRMLIRRSYKGRRQCVCMASLRFSLGNAGNVCLFRFIPVSADTGGEIDY